MNDLYTQLNQNSLLSRFQAFQKMFKGNPEQMVKELLNSGKVSREQYNQAVQIANELRQILGK